MGAGNETGVFQRKGLGGLVAGQAQAADEQGAFQQRGNERAGGNQQQELGGG